MATHHHLKAIALFRGLRGLIVALAGLVLMGQTDQNLMWELNPMLKPLSISNSEVNWFTKTQPESSTHMVQHLVVVGFIWSMFLFV